MLDIVERASETKAVVSSGLLCLVHCTVSVTLRLGFGG
jgi:hypothetical protein